MTRFLGAHVSVAGGLEKGIERATELGINTIQIHPSPPQRWNRSPYKNGLEKAFNEARKSSSVEKVFFHGIYLINLATTDAEKREAAEVSLLNYLDLQARIKGEGVIFHPGTLKGHDDKEAGLKLVSKSLDSILKRAKAGRLLLECTAGGGDTIGRELSTLRFIRDESKEKSRIGFALDTQHMWAAGYNWRDNLPQIIKEIKEELTLDLIGAIHFNDSKSKCSSRVDRHENLGAGEIGEEALRKVLNHKDLRSLPFILETPDLKEMESAKLQVQKLLEMAA